MKIHEMLKASSAGLAAVIRVGTTANFLLDRQQAVGLAPIHPASKVGYIWRRVFLRGKGHRA